MDRNHCPIIHSIPEHVIYDNIQSTLEYIVYFGSTRYDVEDDEDEDDER